MMEIQKYDYISKLPCGCVVGICADYPGEEKDTGKIVGQWIASGQTITRVTHEEACAILKSNGFGCIHAKAIPEQVWLGI